MIDLEDLLVLNLVVQVELHLWFLNVKASKASAKVVSYVES